MQGSNMLNLSNPTWSIQYQRPQNFCFPPTEELSDLSLSGIRLARSARGIHAYGLRDASDVAQSIGSLDVASIPNSCTSTPYVHSCATLPALDNNSMTSPFTFLNAHPPTPHISPSATHAPPLGDECSMVLTPAPQNTDNSLGFYHTHTPTPGGVLPTSSSTPASGTEADIAPDPVAEPKIPRPPNAFILFRSDILKKLREKDPKNKTGKQRFLSQVAGEAWWRITPEERQAFNNLAEEARADHLKKYPNYRFSPQHKGSKVKGRLESDRTDDAASISHFVENVLGIRGKAIQEKPFQPRRKGRPRRPKAPTSQLDTAPLQSANAPASPATGYSAFELGPINPSAFNPHPLDLVSVTQQHISPLDTCTITAPSLPSIIQAPSTDCNVTGLGLTLGPFSPFLSMPQTSLTVEIDNAASLPVTAPASPISHDAAELGPTPAPFIPWLTMPHTLLDSFDYPADHPFVIAPRRPSSSQGFFRHLERGDIISRSASTVPAVSQLPTVHDHVMDPYTWSRPLGLAGDGFTLPSVDAPWDKDVDLLGDA